MAANNSSEDSASPRLEVSPIVNEYLSAYEDAFQQDLTQEPESMIRVSQVLGSAAFLYEKIRNALEYKDEHLIRRSAIERILKRRLTGAGRARETAEALARELIWARYLENDTIPKSKIEKIGRTIEKYLFLRQKALESIPVSKGLPQDESQQTQSQRRTDRGSFREWNEWLLSIASCEIDKEFVLFDGTEALVKLMYKWMKQNFQWVDEQVGQEEKDIQLYIAIHRALVKSDQAILRYHLFNLYYPGWDKAEEPFWSEVAENIHPLKEVVEKHLKSRVGIQLYRYVNRHTAPFIILESLVKENPAQARENLGDAEKFTSAVKEVSDRRYAGVSKRLRKNVVRSIVYVFITKMTVAILLELPYDLLFVDNPRPEPLVANIVFPPFLMFVVGMSIRAPGEDNTTRILRRLKNIVYSGKGSQSVSFTLRPIKRDRFWGIVFGFLYAFFFFVSFGGITALLNRLGFNFDS